jgi:hypothetical protein
LNEISWQTLCLAGSRSKNYAKTTFSVLHAHCACLLQEEEEGCGKEPLDLDNINTVGCLELFEKQFTGNMGIVGGKA